MFSGITSGGEIARQGIAAFRRHPSLFAPVVITWLVSVALVVAVVLAAEDASSGAVWLMILGLYVGVSLNLSLSCFVLLEQVRRIETGQETSLPRAFGVALRNIVPALPIVLIWAIVWLLITIVEAMTRSRDDSYDLGDVAHATFFESLKRGTRMLAFLMYPAIAWERTGPFTAMKRGVHIARTHKKAFATGFALMTLLAGLLAAPVIVLGLLYEAGLDLPDAVWIAACVYGGLVFYLGILIEQLFVAELYMWHLAWEREGRPATLEQVARPSIMDGVPDLTGLPA